MKMTTGTVCEKPECKEIAVVIFKGSYYCPTCRLKDQEEDDRPVDPRYERRYA